MTVVRKRTADSLAQVHQYMRRSLLVLLMPGETSVRLDTADVLADYLGLELVKRKAPEDSGRWGLRYAG